MPSQATPASASCGIFVSQLIVQHLSTASDPDFRDSSGNDSCDDSHDEDEMSDTNLQPDDKCPCGSTLDYAKCCEPYIKGDANPPTAEATMRSRYVAYVIIDNDYLLKTWHEPTRPKEELPADSKVTWTGLEILRTEDGQENDTSGLVEFRAKCRVNGEAGGLDEASDFVKEDGQWFYVDGHSVQPIRTRENKVGRNDPCPCGSGKKFKKCCG